MTYFVLLVLALGLIATAWFCFRWLFLRHRHLPANRVRYQRVRLRLRLHPGRGHATLVELWARWGRFAAFRRSKRARPSLPALARWCDPCEHSVFLGRAQWRHGLRLPVEEHAVVMAPPRTGKTELLAKVILHYPGPVVSTTTKADVFGLTSGVRSRRGPVHVFNPQGIGGVPSTFRWNLIDGCENPQVAIRRADAFANAVEQKGVEGGGWFGAKAAAFLRGLFCAAALAGADMRTVAMWALGLEIGPAQEILWEHGRHEWALELNQLNGNARKTAETIQMSMTQALSFMTDPLLALSVLPAAGTGLDIEAFLREAGTLYMIADSANEQSPLAPLFAAFAAEVHYTAELLGQASPASRLDPPLLMALDEIVQTCPVPLPKWAADSGGKGIQLISVAHGEAQLASRWETHGKQIILDTAGVKVFLPGITDTNTLEMAAKLCGHTTLKEHDGHHRRHEVMTPDMVSMLPRYHALFIRGGLAPVIGKLPAAKRDRLYRTARRAGTAVAKLTAAPPPAVLPLPQPAGVTPANPYSQPIEPPGDDAPAGGEPIPAAVIREPEPVPAEAMWWRRT